MLSSLVKYTNDGAGLEKTLRLIQGFCTIVVGVLDSPFESAPWNAAKSQLALSESHYLARSEQQYILSTRYHSSAVFQVAEMGTLLAECFYDK